MGTSKAAHPPDPEPIEIDGYRVELIWRATRMAAAEQNTAPSKLAEKLAAKGIELILLSSDKAARSAALACLAEAVGGKSI